MLLVAQMALHTFQASLFTRICKAFSILVHARLVENGVVPDVITLSSLSLALRLLRCLPVVSRLFPFTSFLLGNDNKIRMSQHLFNSNNCRSTSPLLHASSSLSLSHPSPNLSDFPIHHAKRQKFKLKNYFDGKIDVKLKLILINFSNAFPSLHAALPTSDVCLSFPLLACATVLKCFLFFFKLIFYN
jgi:hypothetical protein